MASPGTCLASHLPASDFMYCTLGWWWCDVPLIRGWCASRLWPRGCSCSLFPEVSWVRSLFVPSRADKLSFLSHLSGELLLRVSCGCL